MKRLKSFILQTSKKGWRGEIQLTVKTFLDRIILSIIICSTFSSRVRWVETLKRRKNVLHSFSLCHKIQILTTCSSTSACVVAACWRNSYGGEEVHVLHAGWRNVSVTMYACVLKEKWVRRAAKSHYIQLRFIALGEHFQDDFQVFTCSRWGENVRVFPSCPSVIFLYFQK